jgi:3-oxoacyl-[acyl-carrier-protein] synthase II
VNFRHRAVITGVGVLAANGIGKDEFGASLSAGKSGIGPITRFDTTDLPCKIAGEVRDFDPELFIDPALKPRRRMGRFTQLGLAATRMAIDDAGVERKCLSQLPELPIVLGVSTDAQDLRSQKPGLFTAIAGIPSAATSASGYQYSARPRLRTISDGCASGMNAVGAAAEIIRPRRRRRRRRTGGFDAPDAGACGIAGARGGLRQRARPERH